MSSNRSLLYVGAGVLLLVALAVGIVLLAEGRGPVTFEPGSPQDAMQRYLAAWDDRDYETAYEMFSERVQARGSFEQFERGAKDYRPSTGSDVAQAVYIDTAEIAGDEATVYLTVEEQYSDGSLETYRSQREVLMVRQAGVWKIDQPLLGIDVRPFGDEI
jgi:hypothetical protein